MPQRTVLAALVGVLMLCVCLARAEIYFHEEFNSLDGWEQSESIKDYGKVKLSAGELHVDAKKEQGLQLSENAKFYAISKKLPNPVDNEGKDLVVSFSVKHEQDLKCGGGYLKFFSELDQKNFNGDSPYWLMFGPDVCGPNKRVHIILSHDGENHMWKGSTQPAMDKATHVYTLRIAPDNTYELYMDGERKAEGSIEKYWDILAPETIPDADEKKPEDWVDEPTMDDPNDKKPEGWTDEPAEIPDPSAVKPEDWNDEEDGKWEAPKILNPAYKGEWKPKKIPNPAYKGVWEPKKIPNPNYKPEPNLYKVPAPLQYVGIDVWQVEGGSIFDNIIIGDNLQEVLELVKATYGVMAAEEKKMIDAMAAKKEEAAKAAAKAAAEAAAEASKDEEEGEGEEDL
ncbi:putative calreticulin [Leptomonas seymouri]|uniref:Calreticulin n=1 Tax=Leptomonas seymouri TaxID=5684 RepID=A0A0N1IJA0_LEPSE|nr:putative calreticulin [Leptomonas seymouri]|eukprot:KPI84928.1 putative calreticulin [Leptomonas seymouri]